MSLNDLNQPVPAAPGSAPATDAALAAELRRARLWARSGLPLQAGRGGPLNFGFMSHHTGPYLSYAVLCEKVLREADDVLSFIRIVDVVTVTVITPVPASAGFTLSAPPVTITLAIGLKSGEYSGAVAVRVRIETPSGHGLPDFETTAELLGQEHGAAIVLPMQFPAQDEGVYWFVVEVDGEEFTRVPLRIAKNLVQQPVQTQAN